MDKAVELRTLEDEIVRERKPPDMKFGNEFDRDKYELAKTGKKQVLKARIFYPSKVCASI